MRLKIIKIGNQLALPLPENAIKALELSEGSDVLLMVQEESKWILVTAADETVNLEEIDADFARMLSEFIEEYRDALAELS
mgnify:CR=1 FL=1